MSPVGGVGYIAVVGFDHAATCLGDLPEVPLVGDTGGIAVAGLDHAGA